MTEFSTKLFFPGEEQGRIDLRLKMFEVQFEAESVCPRFSPPMKMLAQVAAPGDALMCYQLTSDPPLVLELIQYMRREIIRNKLEAIALNLHEDGLRFGIAISASNFEGEWRDFVTPEGTFMKLEHLFVSRTPLLPNFPEFGVFVRSWNTWKADGRTPED